MIPVGRLPHQATLHADKDAGCWVLLENCKPGFIYHKKFLTD